MSKEYSKKDKPENIDLCENLLDRISQLCMSNNYSDVVFIVEGQRLFAHKCILAAGNKYFQSLLYGGLSESKQNEIDLQVPLEAFKALLRFIYSGRISLTDMEEETILDTLFLAHTYGFMELEATMIEYFKEIVAPQNVLAIFKIAWLCEFQNLKEVCFNIMDINASNILAQESFNHLSKELLHDILCRDSFLAPEFEIFTSVCEWHKNNPNMDVDSLLLNVRLPLMTLNELSKIRKSGIVKLEKLMDAVEMRGKSEKLPYRVWPGENMAVLKYGSKVIQGSWETKPPPPGDIFPDDLDEAKSSKLVAVTANGFEGIVVKLGITSIINHIQIICRNEKFTYYIEVSANQFQWDTVVDYRACVCRNLQTLYFPPKFVKYIKIVGINKNLTMLGLKAAYTEIIPKQIKGFIAANIEICKTEESKGGVKEKKAIFGSYSYSSMRQLRLQLDQPYFVGSLRIYLSDCSKVYYYSIDLSTNESEWWSVANEHNENAVSWVHISCPPRPVVFIKISTYREIVNNIDHYIHFDKVQEATANDDDFKDQPE